jgi:Bacterial Ig-like domain
VLSSSTSTSFPLTFSLSPDNKTITATLSSSLSPTTQYRLRVGYYGALRDWADNYQYTYYDFGFTTQ